MASIPDISTVIISRPREPELARAIVSSLRQNGPEFEVVLVLDGACAHNRAVVSRCHDPRLRVFEHARARGRGAARARALREARGAWICNVDADDWIFQDKQARQWALVQRRPHVDVVSSGLVIADRNGDVAGVRAQSLDGVGLPTRGLPALATPSMMVRASVAKSIQYDARFRAGEDRDFLYRLLPNRRWAALDDASYVYHEYTAHSLGRCLSSYGRRIVMDHRYGGAREGMRSAALNGARAAVSTAAFAAGLGDVLVRRRSSRAPKAVIWRYAQEKEALERALRAL